MPVFYLTDQDYLFRKEFERYPYLHAVREHEDFTKKYVKEMPDSLYLVLINQILKDDLAMLIQTHYQRDELIVNTQNSYVALYVRKDE